MRFGAAALISLFVLAASACGGDDLGAGGPHASTMLRPGAVVYWESVSDPDSDQWQQVEDLLGRFPDGDRWIAQLKAEIENEENVSWERDIKPALGDETAVAVYAAAGGGEPTVVGLTNPEDPDKTVALIKRLDEGEDDEDEEPTVTRVVDDWVVVSDTAAAIDAALKEDGGRALAEDDGFSAAMDALPEDSLTRVYADPATAVDAFGEADPQTRDALNALGVDRLDFAGGWAAAKDDGAEVALALRGEGADLLLGTGEPYSSALLDRVPADAFLFYSFRGEGAKRQLDRLRDNPLYAMGLEEFERQLGIDVDDLAAVLEGEVAFYMRPGSPLPEFALLLDAENEAEARNSLEALLRTLAQNLGGEVTEEGDVTTARFDGFPVHLKALDGAVVVTSSQDGIDDLGESGDKLSDSDRYKGALDAAGAPDEYTGVAYVDLAEAVPLIEEYAGLAEEDLPPEVTRNLDPLESLVLYGKEDGTLSTSLVFLEIE